MTFATCVPTHLGYQDRVVGTDHLGCFQLLHIGRCHLQRGPYVRLFGHQCHLYRVGTLAAPGRYPGGLLI